MNHICFERSSSWRSAKAAKNPPSTMVPPLFLRELRDEVREKVGQVEDSCSRKGQSRALNCLRYHSKLASYQVVRRSSFVQKNWGSICCVCIKYSNCLRRVNVRYSKTSFVMSIRLNRSKSCFAPRRASQAHPKPGICLRIFSNDTR